MTSVVSRLGVYRKSYELLIVFKIFFGQLKTVYYNRKTTIYMYIKKNVQVSTKFGLLMLPSHCV